MMVTMTTVSFYMITAYTPTFGNSVLHLASIDSLIVTLCVGASNLFWLPIMGALSDRIGRRPLLFTFTTLMLLTAYPAMLWLVKDSSFAKLLGVELWLSFIYGSYNGAWLSISQRSCRSMCEPLDSRLRIALPRPSSVDLLLRLAL